MNRPVWLARLIVEIDDFATDLEKNRPDPAEQDRLQLSWSHGMGAFEELHRVLSEVCQ